MAGFIPLGVRVLATVAPPTFRYLAGVTRFAARNAAAPVGDFTRGLIKGTPKYIPIAGTQGARTATVSASLTAGIQTRFIVGAATRGAILSGPRASVAAAKYIAVRAARDSISWYHATSLAYGTLRVGRAGRGVGTAAERVADGAFKYVNRNLDRAGLAPTWTGLGGSLTRGAAIATIYQGLKLTGDKADEIYRLATTYINVAKSYTGRLSPDSGAPSGVLPNPSVQNSGPPAVVGRGVVGPAPVVPIVGGNRPTQPPVTYIPLKRGR